MVGRLALVTGCAHTVLAVLCAWAGLMLAAALSVSLAIFGFSAYLWLSEGP